VACEHLTRQHLQGFGLSPYHAIALSKPCPVQGTSGSSNLYAIAHLRQSARAYLGRPRLRVATRIAVKGFIEQLMALQDNVVPLPFGAGYRGDPAVKKLLQSRSETDPFKLRAAELKGGLSCV
jgi:hypothetical protein